MGFIEDFTKAIDGIADFRPHMFGGASGEELLKLEKEFRGRNSWTGYHLLV